MDLEWLLALKRELHDGRTQAASVRVKKALADFRAMLSMDSYSDFALTAMVREKCLARPELFSHWEKGFIASLSAEYHKGAEQCCLGPKRRAKCVEILEELDARKAKDAAG